MFVCFYLGAVYLEGGLEEAKKLFGRLLFNSEVSFMYVCRTKLILIRFIIVSLLDYNVR